MSPTFLLTTNRSLFPFLGSKTLQTQVLCTCQFCNLERFSPPSSEDWLLLILHVSAWKPPPQSDSHRQPYLNLPCLMFSAITNCYFTMEPWQSLFSSGSDLAPQNRLGDVWWQFLLGREGFLLASSGWRPGMLLNILPCTEQPHNKASNTSIGANDEKPWRRGRLLTGHDRRLTCELDPGNRRSLGSSPSLKFTICPPFPHWEPFFRRRSSKTNVLWVRPDGGRDWTPLKPLKILKSLWPEGSETGLVVPKQALDVSSLAE